MLTRVRSYRPSAAMVVALVALFFSVGGVGYALSGIPDGSGVFHGCVSNKTGVLRVVKSAASCQAPRGHGRHRNPGEFAVTWNQQGPPGSQGQRGLQGQAGIAGSPGAPGTSRAYGAVDRFTAGFLDPGSKNVAGVTNPKTGVYCIELANSIDASTAHLLTTPDYFDSTASLGAIAADVYPETTLAGCSTSPNSLAVVTGYYGISGGTPSFNPMNESFTFAVP